LKYFARLVFIPVAVAVVIFAVMNRGAVTVSLWPLPYDIVIPLFVAVLGAMAAGALLGGGVVWFGIVKWRFKARAGERRARALERELAATHPREDVPASGAAPLALPPRRGGA
jgi:uncharacterized integral membrane protein